MLPTPMLGLKHNINFLVDYDPEWATEFARESQRIADVLGSFAKGIEHYGSTAVKGMRAKPIIDILVGLSTITLFDGWRSRNLMCFPLPLPIVCRGGRKRNWEARQIHPSCAEGRVAAKGPQGRYAPLTRWPLRPSLTAIHCYAPRRAGRDGGMVFSIEHRDGSEDEVIDIPMSFHVHQLPRVDDRAPPNLVPIRGDHHFGWAKPG
jgi:GrpB protein